MIIIVIEVMFLGVNMFLALLRAHFNPRLRLAGKMSLSRAKNVLTLANINSIIIRTDLLHENKRSVYEGLAKFGNSQLFAGTGFSVACVHTSPISSPSRVKQSK